MIEIISKLTVKKDKVIKFNRYQRAGVKEYWIVDPSNETIDVYCHESGVFAHRGIYFKDDCIPVHLFAGFSIDLANVFREEDAEKG